MERSAALHAPQKWPRCGASAPGQIHATRPSVIALRAPRAHQRPHMRRAASARAGQPWVWDRRGPRAGPERRVRRCRARALQGRPRRSAAPGGATVRHTSGTRPTPGAQHSTHQAGSVRRGRAKAQRPPARGACGAGRWARGARLFSMMERGMLPSGADSTGTRRSTTASAYGASSSGCDLTAISPARGSAPVRSGSRSTARRARRAASRAALCGSHSPGSQLGVLGPALDRASHHAQKFVQMHPPARVGLRPRWGLQRRAGKLPGQAGGPHPAPSTRCCTRTWCPGGSWPAAARPCPAQPDRLRLAPGAHGRPWTGHPRAQTRSAAHPRSGPARRARMRLGLGFAGAGAALPGGQHAAGLGSCAAREARARARSGARPPQRAPERPRVLGGPARSLRRRPGRRFPAARAGDQAVSRPGYPARPPVRAHQSTLTRAVPQLRACARRHLGAAA